MQLRPPPSQTSATVPAHSDEMFEVHERILRGFGGGTRYIQLRGGNRVFAMEKGEGPPVLLLHGTSTSSLSHLPMLQRLKDVHAISVDRPGFGLSDPVQVPRDQFRKAATDFIDEVMDELGLETAALAGASMGATWALWHAMERPERVPKVILLGSAPLLPGTRALPPLRFMTTPIIGDLLSRLLKPTPGMVKQLMATVGEKDSIEAHPDLIDSLVAAGKDPVAAAANLDELRAIMSPLGFRNSTRIRQEDLNRVTAPTLMIWGDHDPVGDVPAAHAVARTIPNARLEVVSAGHVPWLHNPDRVSELLSEFVHSDT